MNHVDVDQILEDYAWSHFKDIQSLRKTRLENFKSVERDDCEFVINRKNLTWINEEPQYTNFTPTGSKPYTLFKSVYTNNTNRPQEYSFKTERTTESICSIAREQGYTTGAEAELTLKTPSADEVSFLVTDLDRSFVRTEKLLYDCASEYSHGTVKGDEEIRRNAQGEIAELKAGFKHEMHFNNLNENCQTEILTWGVDSNVQVPPHYSTEASIIIEEMNYRGSYSITTKLSGNVTISIKRRKDDALMLPIRVNIVEVFMSHLDSPHCRKEVKQVVSIDQRKVVRLLSKGTCYFQFAMKQRIDLKENPIKVGNEIMID